MKEPPSVEEVRPFPVFPSILGFIFLFSLYLSFFLFPTLLFASRLIRLSFYPLVLPASSACLFGIFRLAAGAMAPLV
ncbi:MULTISPECIES: hypothetical protein [Halomonas]|uniref:hypothetical protein n=1 Tax=Halomonas TaxID=2745 RepID=UPI001C95ED41|nr:MULTISPECIES: hypothetical protein [Halomonas]MBY6208482.1 hypothetical protein [Halomonas sp. DP3Y7-2]MBY6226953.1 hypothetical protein [Halomonas sp. DP3Y7-1]MCA0915300.1 hypothetical protein [Halomonas denitrificans]